VIRSDLKDFLNYLTFEKNYSFNTIKGYQRDLEEFLTFLENQQINSFNSLEPFHIRYYLLFLKKEKKEPTTIAIFEAFLNTY